MCSISLMSKFCQHNIGLMIASMKTKNGSILNAMFLTVLVMSLLPGCSIVASSSTAQQSPTNAQELAEAVVFVPLSLFVDPSNRQLDNLVVRLISPDVEARIERVLGTLPQFPPNSYSGCHARAHFDYLQLKEISEESFYKIWLLSSSLVSPALGGAISFTPETGNKASWDYHVAVAYTDENKREWIIDRLVSNKPILIGEWIDKFEVDGYAVLTRTPPENYLFNKTSVPASDPINYPDGFLAHFIPKNVFNGTFYQYSGLAAQQHWGASDLAADALSAALQNDEFPECSWKVIASQSLELKQEAGKDQVLKECESARTLYNERFRIWQNLGL